MLRFAPGHGWPMPRHAHPRAPKAANDNRPAPVALPEAALRLFAAAGLDAPRRALAEAEAAAREGDRAGFAHWIGLARAFDRRGAARLTTRYAALRGLQPTG